MLIPVLLVVILHPAVTRAQTAGERCFPETKQCISGRFRAYWEQNGGLAVFGLPTTAAREEANRDTGKSYLTQWFERNRFEYHPEIAAPYDILLGRLGDDRLRQQGVNWQVLPKANAPQSGCLWFAQTGHNVCDQASGAGFKTYWQSHGLADPRLSASQRSLALFGLPLSEPRMETNANGDRVLTQWFERARMEYHPDKPREFKVLLGLLGGEVRGTPAASALKYFWPRQIPPGLAVRFDRSHADGIAFTLALDHPTADEYDMMIRGGTGSDALPRPAACRQPLTIRGQRGFACNTGAGWTVWWAEGAATYQIGGGPLGPQAIVAFAEAFDVLDFTAWRTRLQAVRYARDVAAFPAGSPATCGLPTVPAPADLTKTVRVFFGCSPKSGPLVAAVPARQVAVPAGADPKRIALRALLAGPTSAEKQAGYASTFGAETQAVPFAVEVLAGGLAVVDFDPAIRDVVVVSPDRRTHIFVANEDVYQVVATLAQFPDVKRFVIFVGGQPLCKGIEAC
jgi:hypothetical protein